MNQIEVTVSIITYAHEKYIKQCLDSVFAQETDFVFQVIVAEDASPDNTRQILLEYKEKYGDQLILILHDNNLGPSANNASIIPFIKGKYVAIIEGDDCWTDKKKLQKQYDFLENHSEYSAVACDVMSINTNNEVISRKKLRLKKDIVKTMHNWLNEPYSVHTCTIFHRNIFPTCDPKYKRLRECAPTMGDIITFTLLYEYGPIYVMKEVMAAHREAGENDTSSYSVKSKKNPIQYAKIHLSIFSNLEKYYDYKYDFTKRKCIKIASLRKGRLRRLYSFSNSEIDVIESQFPIKWRIYIRFRVYKMLFMDIYRKVRRTLEDGR